MGLENDFRSALGRVRASEEMKERTLACLAARRRQRGQPLRALAVCAMLALALGVGGWQVLRVPVAYVSVDVNPSVELALNRLDRVVSATAYNEDGEAVLAGVKLEGRSYTQAIDELLDSEAMAPYLVGDYALTLTVAAGSAGEEAALLAGVHGCESYQNNGGESWSADLGSLSEAHAHGMSFGKYAAGQVLQSYDSSVTDSDCHAMTMAEIQTRIHACEHGGAVEVESGHHGSHHGGEHE